MNNEEKILAILEQLQQGQTTTNSRLDKMDSRFDNVDSRLDKVGSQFDSMQSQFNAVQTEVNDLRKTADVTRKAVVRIELEMFPKIEAALDGFILASEKNEAQDERFETLETTVKTHDKRIMALEYAIKKKDQVS